MKDLPAKAPITEALVVVTTKCNMRCPNCFLKIPERVDRRHVTTDELVAWARLLRGVDCIHVTGGEPTTHPAFPYMARLFRIEAKCRSVVVSTNAFSVHGYGLEEFDRIYVSQYESQFYPGFKGNRANVRHLEREHGKKVLVGSLSAEDHYPLITHGGNARPCNRYALGSVLVFDGRVYPCCSAPVPLEAEAGIAMSVELVDGWRDEIARLVPPCGVCRFAEKKQP